MAACLLPRFPECCATAALASPAARQLSQQAAALLSQRFGLLRPGRLPPLQPDGACAAMLAYTHITLGLALPALASALIEASLFQQHQRQRAAAGLPPERGWQAALHGWVASLRQLDWHARLAIAWLLAGIMFDAAVLASGAA